MMDAEEKDDVEITPDDEVFLKLKRDILADVASTIKYFQMRISERQIEIQSYKKNLKDAQSLMKELKKVKILQDAT